jgi:2-desacetyl-2-hydroxyethyl bacteriochlorophyllide A dehydrogenase
MRASAVVATQPFRVEFRSIEAPEPEAEDVVIRVTHSWISNGTEGSFIRGERIGGDTPRRDGDPLPFPHVPGYQKVGVVEAVGSSVRDLEIGEIVFATVSKTSGMFYATGGHVSPAVTHRSQVWKLPPGVSPLAASGLVLTQVGYNVGMRPALQPGDAAVVLGDGMVGHWSAQTLAHRGARVMLIGKHDDRLALFDPGESGIRVNASREDAPEAVRRWAAGGAQVLADTVGSVETVEAFIPLTKRYSHIVSAGFYGERGRLDLQKLRDREMTLHAPSGWSPERMQGTLNLLAQGALQTEHLITHRFPAREAAAAYDLILSRREPVLGVVLDWEEGDR